MKKYLTILLVLLVAVSFGQSTKKVTMASASVVTSTNYSTFNVYSGQAITTAPAYCMQWLVYSDGVSKDDSATLHFEASIDGTTWYKMNNLGAAVTSSLATSTTTYNTTTYSTVFSSTATTTTWTGGSAFFTPTWSLTPPYLRAKVTHFGTGTVTVSGYLYTKQ